MCWIFCLSKIPIRSFSFCQQLLKLESSKMESSSGLSFIKVGDISNPAKLFHEWINEAKECELGMILMNLATATKNGKVSNRTVVVREVMPDASLAFTAQRYSNKIKEIEENPQVSSTILLMYEKQHEKISRQVRLIGIAEKLPQEQCKIYFEKETLSAKIRSWICQECKEIDWNDLKLKHDELLREVIEKNKILEMPENQVAYRIIPTEMEFYASNNNKIADRVNFTLQAGKWHFKRLMA